jgi:hypothetical protein
MKILALLCRAGLALLFCAPALPAVAHAQSVAVLKGNQGCPTGSTEKYIYIDNEDTSNANTDSGWLGATVSTENTHFRFCSVNANFFATTEPYALLSLDGNCPFGSTRFRRIIDANNNFFASDSTSSSDIPGVLFHDANSPDYNVHMTFCAFPGTGGVTTPNPFPDLGVEYGVFAPSNFSYGKQTGSLYMDDDDVGINGTNDNRWCNAWDSCTSENQNYYNIMSGGLNTSMNLALVRQCSNGGNIIPALIGSSGRVTRSGVYSVDYEAWKAFDGDNASMWISATFQTPAWISYNFGSPQIVTQYAITFSNGSLTTRAPKDWTLQGWSGSAWVNIDTRSGQINWAGTERRQYSIAAPGNYSQYRLNIIDDNDSRTGVVVISIGRLEFIAQPGCS